MTLPHLRHSGAACHPLLSHGFPSWHCPCEGEGITAVDTSETPTAGMWASHGAALSRSKSTHCSESTITCEAADEHQTV
eukprot:5201269-Alexandrium_andersonii.AAC.1